MGLSDHLAGDTVSMLSTEEFARTVTLWPHSARAVEVSAIFDSSIARAGDMLSGVDAWVTLAATDGNSLKLGDLIKVGSDLYRIREPERMDAHMIAFRLERQ